MATFDDLLPDIQVEIPEIPSFVAQRSLIRAMREFCEETRAWRISFNASTLADDPLLPLISYFPDFTELVDVITIKNVDGGEPVEPRTYAWFDKNLSDWRSDSAIDANYYVLEDNNTIRLVPYPTETIVNKYYVRAAIKPLLTTTTLDDRMVNKYSETLIHGALAKLYAIPRKPWTDLQLASIHDAQFRVKFGQARTEAAEEFQTGVPRKVKYGGV